MVTNELHNWKKENARNQGRSKEIAEIITKEVLNFINEIDNGSFGQSTSLHGCGTKLNVIEITMKQAQLLYCINTFNLFIVNQFVAMYFKFLFIIWTRSSLW